MIKEYIQTESEAGADFSEDEFMFECGNIRAEIAPKYSQMLQAFEQHLTKRYGKKKGFVEKVRESG